MTTTQLPRTITATIHQDAINRVSEFFTAATSDIMNELLQNSRRSGASRVNVRMENSVITVSDDGRGIADPEAILAFGLTGWDDRTASKENPAGMGFYALARRDQVTIRSKTTDRVAWKVTLTPDHFTGKLSAPIERVDGGQTATGTTVTFNAKPGDETAIRNAVKHYTLPVSMNDEAAEQSDFLADAAHIEEWHGIRIGVYRNPGAYSAPYTTALNFHGVIVQKPWLPKVIGIDTNWTTQADVKQCPELKLTLPARREVVESPFMGELREACQTAVYRAMSLHPEKVDVPRKVQQAAAAIGITLPDASPRLEQWAPRKADTDHYYLGSSTARIRTGKAPIIIDLDVEPPDEQTLARAASRADITGRFFKANHNLDGYDWYDRIPKATKLTITVSDQQGDHDLQEVRLGQESLATSRPHRINVAIETTTTDVAALQATINLPADVAFEKDEQDYIDTNTPLVTEDSNIMTDELTELMIDAFFCPSDDHEADSVETQEIYHREAYETTVIELLQSKDDATIAAIANAVSRHVMYAVPHGTVATITIKRPDPIRITLEPESP